MPLKGLDNNKGPAPASFGALAASQPCDTGFKGGEAAQCASNVFLVDCSRLQNSLGGMVRSWSADGWLLEKSASKLACQPSSVQA